MLVPVLISIIYASALVAGANDTDPVAESEHPVGWQSSPERRGTWDIITSCAITIFACTWSIQHLNVRGPPSRDGTMKTLLRSCKWMVITILFPEFIMAHAFFELKMAVQATERVKRVRAIATYPWLIEVLFQNRAGNYQKRQDNQHVPKQHYPPKPEWTLEHSYFANMGGLYYDGGEGVCFPLTAFQYAQRSDFFELPDMTKEEIMDKGKQDFFAKGLAVLQISQLVLSLIVRRIQRLPFSQLETFTLGLAVCGVVTYVLYWYKPQGVGVPVQVKKKRDSDTAKFEKTYDSAWKVLRNDESSNQVLTSRIPNDNIPKGTSAHEAIPVLAVLSAAFGCLHFIAWNFEFPTAVEQLLWRIATVLSITVPVLGLTTIPLAQIPVQTGNPRDFMRHCLYMLRELSWHYPDNDKHKRALEAITELENTYNSPAGNTRRPYKEIFPSQEIQNILIDFIENEAPFDGEDSPELPKNFKSQLRLLIQRMHDEGPKNLIENAKTDVFPQRSLLPKGVNLGVLYMTSLFYCISRLTIMALALSSLRSMPDKVYVTTWTMNIPSVH
ncbi:hypothetical protein N7510_004281 [Penicillium lagena]|uniref:uncharacterized protein n=1 Tax=Penicillium lagena TaxID=94218 RepID=UPI00253FF0F8|nr:uncharacterized protein N7510_004281 [Penicillium lagena]KAJ5620297.1 hypothetical protein N7510_004281 [Penicillium lagena]